MFKRWFLLSRGILASFFLTAATGLYGQDVLEFDLKEFDFKTIGADAGKVTHRFLFKNVSGDSLRITKVDVSCGCTASEWTKGSIPPGGKGFVEATFNPEHREGPFTKSLAVTTNKSKERDILVIKGDIKKGNDLAPEDNIYIRHFSFNKSDLGQNENDYKTLLKTIQKIAQSKERVHITIESSASKVPTASFKNNELLAERRAAAAMATLVDDLKKLRVSVEKIDFHAVKALVQGPDYDPGADQSKYEPFQYVKIMAH